VAGAGLDLVFRLKEFCYRLLEGMVRCARAGRESRFAFDPRPVEEMREYLASVSAQWDAALGRLKAFVEE
jgi:hypothetical protein